jgi:hypothetical protein
MRKSSSLPLGRGRSGNRDVISVLPISSSWQIAWQGLLISFIKAWTNNEGKKDRDILDAAQNPSPAWPWSTQKEFQGRLEEARLGAFRETPVSR